jgi:uncharacterized delta-60 repeat protein
MAGDLDTTFDGDGKVTTDFATTEFGGALDRAYSVAVQSDGKIVVAGNSLTGNGEQYNFALARYNANGSLDTTFDGDGKVTTDFGGGDDTAHSVAIQSNGKIVVAGKSYNGSKRFDFALTRYNANGSLDTTFDGDGKVTTDFGGGDDTAHSVAIQSDGKIVVAGYIYKVGGDDFALARYNANGSLDTTFDGDGKVTTDFGVSLDRAYSVAIQSDGKIVVAGESYNGSKWLDFALTRYNANGSLDTTFDGDGKVTTDFGGGDDTAHSVAIQSDGKIVLAGSSGIRGTFDSDDFALTRYNANGSLDTTFDGDGKVTTDFGKNLDDHGYSVAIQSDGKIVVAGESKHVRGGYDFALARYNANGSLNTSFDGDGKVTTTIGIHNFGANYGAFGVAIQSDGKIVVAGDGPYDFALARYNASDAPTDITLSLTSIAESATANTTVGTLSTIDPDAGDTFTYTLVSGADSIDNAAFSISSNSLRATSSFDFETKSSYTIRIRSTDQGGFFTEKTFTITVIDINESPTNISLSSKTISENSAANTPVGTLNTADPDTENTFTYTLVTGSGDTDNASFNISANSLRATSSFDFETKSSYTVRIRSTDQNGLFVENAFAIQVVNANETPTEIGLSWNMLAENAGFDKTVGTFSTTDVDAGSTFTYSFVTGAGDANNASFRFLGSALVAISNFDFETKSSYSIRVRSTDQGGLFVEKTFVITVIDVNEAPTDISLSSSTIAENAAANTPVGTLSTADPDAGNSVAYALVAGSGDANNAAFNIAGSILRATNTFNFEAKSSYSIRVRSTDQGGLFTEKTLTITVTNINETPTDISLSSNSSAENAGANAVVGALSTIDPDSGNTFTYSLIMGAGDADNESFNINGSTLHAISGFNFETKSSYSVHIRSTDQNGLFVEKAFAIQVVNVNETPIDISLTSTTILENSGPNAMVGTLSTADVDSGNTFVYSLVAGSGGTDNAAFNVSGSTLRATSSFDFETRSDYTVRVRSTDQGGLFVEKVFAIRVVNANDAPVAVGDSYWVLVDTVKILDVLVNDSDVDNAIDPTSIEIFSPPLHGTATPMPDGTVRYTPNEGYRGAESFTYRVRDSLGFFSNAATVQLRINSAPNTNPDSLVVKKTITTVLDVLRNDSNPDGTLDPATLVIFSGSDMADVVVQSNGTIRFTPRARFLGTTQFRYVVSDNDGRPSVPTDVTVQVVVSIYQNPRSRFDVDDDGSASPLDVLVLINLLNSQAPSLPVDGLPGPPAYVDVNADNRVDPLDVLDVINHINSRGNGEGEGNAAFTFDDVFASDDWQKELRKSKRRSLTRF